MLSFFNRTFTQISKKSSKMKVWKTEIVAWKTEIVAPLIFKKYKKSTLRKAYKKWISFLGFIFFNRTFTHIFKKSIFRTILIWRHCKSPRILFCDLLASVRATGPNNYSQMEQSCRKSESNLDISNDKKSCSKWDIICDNIEHIIPVFGKK